jgi:hypothetical protein
MAPEVGYWREARSLPLAVLIMTRKLFSKLFVNALNETGGNLNHAAEGLKMSLLGLKKVIRRLGIR